MAEINLPVKLQIQNLQQLVSEMQSKLGTLKIGSSGYNSMLSTIKTIGKEIDKLSIQASKPFINENQFTQAEKSVVKLEDEIEKVSLNISRIKFSDIELTASQKADLKAFDDQITAIKNNLKTIKATAKQEFLNSDLGKAWSDIDASAATKSFDQITKAIEKAANEQQIAVDKAKKVASDYQKAFQENQRISEFMKQIGKDPFADTGTFDKKLREYITTTKNNTYQFKSGGKNLMVQWLENELKLDSGTLDSLLKQSVSANNIGEKLKEILNEQLAKNLAITNNNSQENLNKDLADKQAQLDQYRSMLQQAGLSQQQMAIAEEALRAALSNTSNAYNEYKDNLTNVVRTGKDWESTTTAMKSQLDTFRTTLDQTNASFLQMERTQQTFNQMKTAVVNFMGFNQVLNLTKTAIKNAVNHIKELDTVMNGIAIVTDMSTGDLWNQVDAYSKMAQSYGVSIKGAYEVSQIYYQQGLQTADVLTLTNETLKLAKISGLDYATTTDYMTTAIRGFKMEMSEASTVVDVYSNLAAHTAVSQEELAVAMSKTASSMEGVGATFEEASAMIGTMVAVTRESATNIGSAMKSIASRYGELTKDPTKLVDEDGEAMAFNKVDAALQSVGISMKTVDGQFREFTDVIVELGEKWDQLDSVQQRYIATQFAGNRQQSRFLALVSNVDLLKSNLDVAMNSEDTGTLQTLKALDSIESKTEQVRVAYQQFYTTIGAESVWKGFLDSTKNVIDTLNSLPKLFGKIPVSAIAVVYDIISLVKGVLINGISSLASIIVNKVGETTNELTNTANKGQEIGQNFVDKIITGITSRYSALKSAAEKGVEDAAMIAQQKINEKAEQEKNRKLTQITNNTNQIDSNKAEIINLNSIIFNEDINEQNSQLSQLGLTLEDAKNKVEVLKNANQELSNTNQELKASINEETGAEENNSAAKEKNALKTKEGAKAALEYATKTHQLSTATNAIASGLSLAATMIGTTGRAAQLASGHIMLLSGALRGAGAIVEWVSTGMNSAFPWMAAVTAVIGIVNGLSTIIETPTEKLERLTQEAENLSNEAKQAKAEYRTLDNSISKLEELKEKRYESAEAAEEYQTAVDDLAEKFPEMIAGFDEAGNIILNTTDAESVLTAARKKSAEATYEAAKAEYNKINESLKQQRVENINRNMGHEGAEFADYVSLAEDRFGSKIGAELVKLQKFYNGTGNYLDSEEGIQALREFEQFLKTAQPDDTYDEQGLANLKEAYQHAIGGISDAINLVATGKGYINSIVSSWQQIANADAQAWVYLNESAGATAIVTNAISEDLINGGFEPNAINAQIMDNRGNYRTLMNDFISSLSTERLDLFNSMFGQSDIFSAEDFKNEFKNEKNWNNDLYQIIIDYYNNSETAIQTRLMKSLEQSLSYIDQNNNIQIRSYTSDSFYDKFNEESKKATSRVQEQLLNNILSSYEQLSDKGFITQAENSGKILLDVFNKINDIGINNPQLYGTLMSSISQYNLTTKNGIEEFISYIESTETLVDDEQLKPLLNHLKESLTSNVSLSIQSLTSSLTEGWSDASKTLSNLISGIDLSEVEKIISQASKFKEPLNLSFNDFRTDEDKLVLIGEKAQQYWAAYFKEQENQIKNVSDELDNAIKDISQIDDINKINKETLDLSKLGDLIDDTQAQLYQTILGSEFTNYFKAEIDEITKEKTGKFEVIKEYQGVSLEEAVLTAFNNNQELVKRYYQYLNWQKEQIMSSYQWSTGDYSNLGKNLFELKDLASGKLELGINDTQLKAAKESINSAYNNLISDVLSKGFDNINLSDYEGLVDMGVSETALKRALKSGSYQKFVESYAEWAGKSIDEINDLLVQAMDKDLETKSESLIQDFNFIDRDTFRATYDTLGTLASAYDRNLSQMIAASATIFDQATGEYVVSVSKLKEFGIDLEGINHFQETVQESIDSMFDSITSDIESALEGKLDIQSSVNLRTNLSSLGINNLTETSFTKTAEGLKLTEDAFFDLYKSISDIDKSLGRKIIPNLAKMSKQYSSLQKVLRQYKEATVQAKDSAKSFALNDLLSSMLRNPDSYNLMDTELSDTWQSASNFYSSVRSASNISNSMITNGQVSAEDFYSLMSLIQNQEGNKEYAQQALDWMQQSTAYFFTDEDGNLMIDTAAMGIKNLQELNAMWEDALEEVRKKGANEQEFYNTLYYGSESLQNIERDENGNVSIEAIKREIKSESQQGENIQVLLDLIKLDNQKLSETLNGGLSNEEEQVRNKLLNLLADTDWDFADFENQANELFQNLGVGGTLTINDDGTYEFVIDSSKSEVSLVYEYNGKQFNSLADKLQWIQEVSEAKKSGDVTETGETQKLTSKMGNIEVTVEYDNGTFIYTANLGSQGTVIASSREGLETAIRQIIDTPLNLDSTENAPETYIVKKGKVTYEVNLETGEVKVTGITSPEEAKEYEEFRKKVQENFNSQQQEPILVENEVEGTVSSVTLALAEGATVELNVEEVALSKDITKATGKVTNIELNYIGTNPKIIAENNTITGTIPSTITTTVTGNLSSEDCTLTLVGNTVNVVDNAGTTVYSATVPATVAEKIKMQTGNVSSLKCQLQIYGNFVRILDEQGNEYTGILPASVATHTIITAGTISSDNCELKISGNEVTITDPATGLIYTGTVPDSVKDHISELTGGIVDSTKCQLKITGNTVTILDLNGNEIFTGTMPATLGDQVTLNQGTLVAKNAQFSITEGEVTIVTEDGVEYTGTIPPEVAAALHPTGSVAAGNCQVSIVGNTLYIHSPKGTTYAVQFVAGSLGNPTGTVAANNCDIDVDSDTLTIKLGEDEKPYTVNFAEGVLKGDGTLTSGQCTVAFDETSGNLTITQKDKNGNPYTVTIPSEYLKGDGTVTTAEIIAALTEKSYDTSNIGELPSVPLGEVTGIVTINTVIVNDNPYQDIREKLFSGTRRKDLAEANLGIEFDLNYDKHGNQITYGKRRLGEESSALQEYISSLWDFVKVGNALGDVDYTALNNLLGKESDWDLNDNKTAEFVNFLDQIKDKSNFNAQSITDSISGLKELNNLNATNLLTIADALQLIANASVLLQNIDWNSIFTSISSVINSETGEGTLNLNINGDTTEVSNKIKSLIAMLAQPQFLKITSNISTVISNIETAITKLTSTPRTIKIIGEYTPPKILPRTATATGNVALAQGTLMGELGPELYVTGGHYYIAGQNGAEMVDLPEDAIVFNHLQTKRLLNSGHGGRGKPNTNERVAAGEAHPITSKIVPYAVADNEGKVSRAGGTFEVNSKDSLRNGRSGGGNTVDVDVELSDDAKSDIEDLINDVINDGFESIDWDKYENIPSDLKNEIKDSFNGSYREFVTNLIDMVDMTTDEVIDTLFDAWEKDSNWSKKDIWDNIGLKTNSSGGMDTIFDSISDVRDMAKAWGLDTDTTNALLDNLWSYYDSATDKFVISTETLLTDYGVNIFDFINKVNGTNYSASDTGSKIGQQIVQGENKIADKIQENLEETNDFIYQQIKATSAKREIAKELTMVSKGIYEVSLDQLREIADEWGYSLEDLKNISTDIGNGFYQLDTTQLSGLNIDEYLSTDEIEEKLQEQLEKDNAQIMDAFDKANQKSDIAKELKSLGSGLYQIERSDFEEIANSFGVSVYEVLNAAYENADHTYTLDESKLSFNLTDYLNLDEIDAKYEEYLEKKNSEIMDAFSKSREESTVIQGLTSLGEGKWQLNESDFETLANALNINVLDVLNAAYENEDHTFTLDESKLGINLSDKLNLEELDAKYEEYIENRNSEIMDAFDKSQETRDVVKGLDMISEGIFKIDRSDFETIANAFNTDVMELLNAAYENEDGTYTLDESKLSFDLSEVLNQDEIDAKIQESLEDKNAQILDEISKANAKENLARSLTSLGTGLYQVSEDEIKTLADTFGVSVYEIMEAAYKNIDGTYTVDESKLSFNISDYLNEEELAKKYQEALETENAQIMEAFDEANQKENIAKNLKMIGNGVFEINADQFEEIANAYEVSVYEVLNAAIKNADGTYTLDESKLSFSLTDYYNTDEIDEALKEQRKKDNAALVDEIKESHSMRDLVRDLDMASDGIYIATLENLQAIADAQNVDLQEVLAAATENNDGTYNLDESKLNFSLSEYLDAEEYEEKLQEAIERDNQAAIDELNKQNKKRDIVKSLQLISDGIYKVTASEMQDIADAFGMSVTELMKSAIENADGTYTLNTEAAGLDFSEYDFGYEALKKIQDSIEEANDSITEQIEFYERKTKGLVNTWTSSIDWDPYYEKFSASLNDLKDVFNDAGIELNEEWLAGLERDLDGNYQFTMEEIESQGIVFTEEQKAAIDKYLQKQAKEREDQIKGDISNVISTFIDQGFDAIDWRDYEDLPEETINLIKESAELSKRDFVKKFAEAAGKTISETNELYFQAWEKDINLEASNAIENMEFDAMGGMRGSASDWQDLLGDKIKVSDLVDAGLMTYNAKLKQYVITSIQPLIDMGLDPELFDTGLIQDSIQNFFSELSSKIADGLAGTLSNVDAKNLEELLKLNGLGNIDLTFTETVNGLKLSQESAIELYYELRKIDALKAELVFDELRKSLEESNDNYKTMSSLLAHIKDLQDKIADSEKYSDVKIKQYERELELAKEIAEIRATSEDSSYNFLDAELPGALNNPLNYISSWQSAAQAMHDATEKGVMDYKTLYNMAKEMNTQAVTLGKPLQLLGYTLDGTAESFGEFAKAMSASIGVGTDDKTIGVVLKKMGDGITNGADEFAGDTDDAMHTMAKSQIEIIKGLINVLDTIIALEDLQALDLDENGIFNLDDVIEYIEIDGEKVAKLKDSFVNIRDTIMQMVTYGSETYNSELDKALSQIKINGKNFKDVLMQTADEWTEMDAEVINAVLQAVSSGDYDLNNIAGSLRTILKDKIQNGTIELGDMTLEVRYGIIVQTDKEGKYLDSKGNKYDTPEEAAKATILNNKGATDLKTIEVKDEKGQTIQKVRGTFTIGKKEVVIETSGDKTSYRLTSDGEEFSSVTGMLQAEWKKYLEANGIDKSQLSFDQWRIEQEYVVIPKLSDEIDPDQFSDAQIGNLVSKTFAELQEEWNKAVTDEDKLKFQAKYGIDFEDANEEDFAEFKKLLGIESKVVEITASVKTPEGTDNKLVQAIESGKADVEINLVGVNGESGELTVNADAAKTTTEEFTNLVKGAGTAVDELNKKEITVSADAARKSTEQFISEIERASRSIDNINSKAINVAVNALQDVKSLANALGDVEDQLSSLKSLSSNGLLSIDVNVNEGGKSEAKGNVALAGGNTLMGELGPELVVSHGRYFVVGNNGAEFVDLPKDAIVFNHLQTAQLLNSGHTSRGSAYTTAENAVSMAYGNTGVAMASAREARATLQSLLAMWESMLSMSVKDLVSSAAGEGSSARESTWLADVERWYNLLQKIARLEKEINYQEALRQKISSDLVPDGKAYYETQKQSLENYKDQANAQRELYESRQKYFNKRREELNSEKSPFSKFYTYDEYGQINFLPGAFAQLQDIVDVDENGRPKYTAEEQYNIFKSLGLEDYMKYDSSGNEIEQGDNFYSDSVKAVWERMEKERTEMQTLYDMIEEGKVDYLEALNSGNELLHEILDNQRSLEDKLLDAVTQHEQAVIDGLNDEKDALQKNADAYINGLKDALNKERELYNRNQDVDELTKLQRQLSILERSGGSASQISSLRKEIQQKQQDQYFEEQERQIEAVQEASDAQIERLDTQINILTEALEYEKANGLLWNKVYELMAGPREEMLEYIITNVSSFKELSTLGQNEEMSSLQFMIDQFLAFREDSNETHSIIVESLPEGFEELVERLYSPTEEEELKKIEETNEKAKEENEKLANKTSSNNGNGTTSITSGSRTSSGGAPSSTFNKMGYVTDKVQDTTGKKTVTSYDATQRNEELKRQQKYLDWLKEQKTAAEGQIKAYNDAGNTAEAQKISDNIKNWLTPEMTKTTSKISQLQAKNSAYTSYLYEYAHGGLVNYTGLAKVHGTKSRPEAFVNAEEVQMWKEDILGRGAHSLLGEMLQLRALYDSVSNSTDNINSNDNSIIIEHAEVNMNVEQIANDYDARRAGENALNEMIKIARKQGMNSVRR